MEELLEKEMDNRYYTVLAMKTYGGSFVQALSRAFECADMFNFAKLKNAFPEYWEEYQPFAEKLKKDAKEI